LAFSIYTLLPCNGSGIILIVQRLTQRHPLGSWIKEKQQTAAFFGANSTWLEKYYDLYLEDPQLVTPELQTLFKEFDQDEPDVRHLPIIEKFKLAGQLSAGSDSEVGNAVHTQKQADVSNAVERHH